MKTEAALAGLRAVAQSARRRQAQLDDPAADRRDQTGPARRDRAVAALQGAAKKNFSWRRPRHTLKGRQIAAEIERAQLRLQLRKAQAEAGDISERLSLTINVRSGCCSMAMRARR